MKYIIYVLPVIFAVFPARADLTKATVFGLNTIYMDRDYDDNGVESRSKATDTDLRLTRVEKNWGYGAIYSLSSNDSSDASRSSYGLSVGYYSDKDFYMAAHYFLSSTYKFGGTEYTKGSGYEVDIGMLSKITSSVYIGLLVALKNFSYSDSNAGSVSVTHRELFPMFSLAIAFR